jgi:RHS repeat-associated protein
VPIGRQLTSAATTVFVVFLATAFPHAATGQGKPRPRPDCVTGCTTPVYSVAVTPDGATTAPRPVQSGPHFETFTVKNTGSGGATDTYTITCSGAGGVTCSNSSLGSKTLTVGSSTTVKAFYGVGPTPGTGQLTVRAMSPTTDAFNLGYFNVPIVVNPVAVTPDGGTTLDRPTQTTGHSESFTVANTSSVSATFTLSCSATGNVTCTGTSSPSITLGAGASSTVTASYSVGAVGTGTLILTGSHANGSDQGSYSINVVGAGPFAPAVALDQVNPGATIERGLCLIVALGPAAAAECGDLRLVHSLSTTRTLNKARTPTLLYNSQQAHPYPLVVAMVTLPGTATVPDSLTGALTIGGVERARGKWVGSEWTAGAARRIVLGFDASTDASGVYTYTLELRNWYGSSSLATTASGQIAIVNRSNSAFGAGWWLAGLEELNVGTMVWTGGDGSLRQYQPVSGMTNVWVAPSLDHPDTLKFDGTTYSRFDQAGVRVQFDATGKHVGTVNRLGHLTTFAYTSGRLSTITLPPASANRSYQFAYDLTAGRLQSVSSPGPGTSPRMTGFSGTGGQIASITDPGGQVVGFGYSATLTRLVVSRTDRRGTVTSYTFDGGRKVAQSSTAMGAGNPPVVMGLKPRETLGLTGTSSVAELLAYTRLDGPRTDVADTTLFWQDRFGTPTKIVDALGNATLFSRGDSRWPALVTRVQHANGQVVSADYDGRGNMTATTDSSTVIAGTYATTRYEWDPKWDAVTKVVQPEKDSMVLVYDATNGNRLWQQDGRGATSRVNFTYHPGGVPSGLLAGIKPPLAPVTSIGYDPLGNLRTVTSPRGITTTHYGDGAGRDTLIVGAIDTAQTKFRRDRTEYDVMDRVLTSIGSGPTSSSGGAVDSVVVLQTYDAEGNPLSTARRASPDTAHVGVITTTWRYDAAGRQVAEVAPDGVVDSTGYDLGGNPVAQVTRRGHVITLQYDMLNRLTVRTVPEVVYSDTTANGWRFPLYPNWQGTKLRISGDTIRYTYDAMGNTLTANNGDSRIRRTYNPNGTLATDSLWVRTVAEVNVGGNFTSHAYGLRFGYDRNGRRTWMKYPRQLGARFAGSWTTVYDSVAYGYEAGTGALARLRDVLGSEFRYAYDLDGRVDTLVYPQGHFKRFSYDADGQPSLIRQDRTSTGSGSNEIQLLFRDARGNPGMIKPFSSSEQLTYGYSGLNTLRESHEYTSTVAPRWDHQGFSVDGMANLVWESSSFNTYRYVGCTQDIHQDVAGSSTTHRRFQAATGRLLVDSALTTGSVETIPLCRMGSSSTGRIVRRFGYDPAGNTIWMGAEAINTEQQSIGSPDTTIVRRASFYDALGRLRVIDARGYCYGECLVKDRAGFEELRYDALGRRVWRRLRREATTIPATGEIQRFIWDGSSVVQEILAPGAEGVGVADLERDAASAPSDSSVGGVLYLHGSDIDQPVEAVRTGFGAFDPLGLAPHWNWRGQVYAHAFYGPTPSCRSSGGSQVCVSISWPNFVSYNRQVQDYGGANALWGSRPLGGWFGSLLENQETGTGEMYRRNRYYDPQSGRFTQEDPIGLAGGVNLYSYAGSNPVSYSDPFGLCATGGGTDFYYDICGNVTSTKANGLDSDRYFLNTGDRIIQIDQPLSSRNPVSGIVDAPVAIDQVARSLARAAPNYAGSLNTFRAQSNEGKALDFKLQLHGNILWNAGKGMYWSNDKVANVAWGYYADNTMGYSLAFALAGAQYQAIRRTGRPDDPIDQTAIRRGYSIP